MNLKKLFLPILALAALTGCKDEPVVVEAPVITFNQTEWEVENAGGQIAVGYSIANPVEGASIEVTTEATWIENFDTTVEGVIMFSVLENEVEEQYANQIITEIEASLKKETDVSKILANIYQKIVLKLGQTKTLEVVSGKTKYIFFIGPTGVGKTTTIAKLAYSLMEQKKAKVALLAADTYRIAAVDQLRTYADIMNVPLFVIYSETELEEYKDELEKYDVRCIIDDRSEKITRKIRDNEMKHIPYMLIVGEKEQAEGTVTVRKQGGINEGSLKIEDFGKKIEEEVNNMINKW